MIRWASSRVSGSISAWLTQGGVNESRDVPGDVSALHGDLERAGQYPVNLQHRGGGKALIFQVGVEPLQMFGSKPVEPVFPKAGNDPVADLRRICTMWCKTSSASRSLRVSAAREN